MLCFPVTNDQYPTPVLGLSPDDATNPANSTVELMDSETAALIRAFLRPLFDRPHSWPALADKLHANGYGLAFRAGRMCLTELATGKCLCSLRFLGIVFLELVTQLGRPTVRVLPNHSADGELVHHVPLARRNQITHTAFNRSRKI